MTFFNLVVLAGKVMAEPFYGEGASRFSNRHKGDGSEGDRPFDIVKWQMLSVSKPPGRMRPSRVIIYCLAVGAVGSMVRWLDLKKGDYVMVQGLLDTEKRGKFNYHIIRASWVRALYPPPNRFIRGHVQMSKSEYRRLRRMTGAGSEEISREKLIELGVIGRSEPDPLLEFYKMHEDADAGRIQCDPEEDPQNEESDVDNARE